MTAMPHPFQQTPSGLPRTRTLTSAFASWRRAISGAIAVEFGLIMPVAMILMLGVVDASLAISDQLTLQAAARAGAQFGLVKPPVQGNTAPLVASVRAAMPAEWSDNYTSDNATVAAAVVCECEFTGAIQCGNACAVNERLQSYVQVQVTRPYKSLVNFLDWTPQLTLGDTTRIRLQ
ncbi:MAG: TadE/TadG family type IV pilus assembly protein [Hyphomicrobium sp.]